VLIYSNSFLEVGLALQVGGLEEEVLEVWLHAIAGYTARMLVVRELPAAREIADLWHCKVVSARLRVPSCFQMNETFAFEYAAQAGKTVTEYEPEGRATSEVGQFYEHNCRHADEGVGPDEQAP
jgi:hypothetical protein